ncbi:MAG: FHA domain-containing protein [Bacteriovoracaceae bacterium]
MAANEAKVKIIKGFKVPNRKGSFHRLLCLTGKNKGLSYYLQSNRIILGRSNTVDIQIADVKSSREHAELKLFKNGYVISDLGSQNGVIVNDLKIAQHQLVNGDKIIIGQTVYKYDLIVNEKPELSLVKSTDSIASGKKASSQNEEEDDEAENTQDKEKVNKRIAIIAILGIVAWFMLGGDEETSQKKRIKGKAAAPEIRDNFAEKLKAKKREDDQEQAKKLQVIIGRGLREYREENYFRAINEFNLALIIDPNNSRARFYRDKTQQSLHDEIDTYLQKGQQEIDANKFNKAKVSYCEIVRLLQNFPEDPSYKSALEKLADIETELGLEKGEIDCFNKSNGK